MSSFFCYYYNVFVFMLYLLNKIPIEACIFFFYIRRYILCSLSLISVVIPNMKICKHVSSWSWTKLDSFIWFTFLIGKLRILFVLVIREDSLESWRQLNEEASISEKLRWFTWIGQSLGHNFQNFTRDLIMKLHDYLVFTVTRWFCQSSIGMCFWIFFGSISIP